MKKYLFGLSILALSSISNADCTTSGCENVYVEKLYVTTSGVVYIGTSGDETKMPCKAASGIFVTLNLSSPGANAIYSALLTAQTSNKVVQLRTDEASVGCNVLYMTIDRQ